MIRAASLANSSRCGAGPEGGSRSLSLSTALFVTMMWLPGLVAEPQQPPLQPERPQQATTVAPPQQPGVGPTQQSMPSQNASQQQSTPPSPQQPAHTPQQSSRSNEAGDAAGAKQNNGLLPFIGLLGAIVGASISWIAASRTADKTHKLARLREKEGYEHRKTAFRNMLEIEIEQNLEMLAWDQKTIDSCPSDVSLPLWMAGIACPAWSTTVWESGLALWPDVFSDRQQCMDLQFFFVHLRSLSSVRGALTTLVSNAKDPGVYSDQRTALVKQARALASGIHRRGNPLQQDNPADKNTSSPGSEEK